jgi:hypothetical protein
MVNETLDLDIFSSEFLIFRWCGYVLQLDSKLGESLKNIFFLSEA